MSPTGNQARPDAKDRNGPGQRRGSHRLLIVALVAVVAVIGLGLSQTLTKPAVQSPPAAGAGSPQPGPGGAAAEAVVRESSHRLAEAPDGKVTFVEFLDFECESCGAVHPAIEQLRQQYQGRVTFVVRYFPMDGHFNAKRAARAVEAAAQQGQFEAMYQKMFTTQSQWGEQQTPKDDLFRSYATDLGLDVAKWDADYTSPATTARIQADIDDGTALGVTGTPTFFLNGQPFAPQTMADLTEALDDALAA